MSPLGPSVGPMFSAECEQYHMNMRLICLLLSVCYFYIWKNYVLLINSLKFTFHKDLISLSVQNKMKHIQAGWKVWACMTMSRCYYRWVDQEGQAWDGGRMLSDFWVRRPWPSPIWWRVPNVKWAGGAMWYKLVELSRWNRDKLHLEGLETTQILWPVSLDLSVFQDR